MSLLRYGHGAEPGLGQQRDGGFAVDVQAEHSLRKRPGQDVKEDRSDEGLERQQREVSEAEHGQGDRPGSRPGKGRWHESPPCGRGRCRLDGSAILHGHQSGLLYRQISQLKVKNLPGITPGPI